MGSTSNRLTGRDRIVGSTSNRLTGRDRIVVSTSNRLTGRDRIVVSTSRCGRDNPGCDVLARQSVIFFLHFVPYNKNRYHRLIICFSIHSV